MRAWANWSGLFRASPRTWATPGSEEELVTLVRRTRDARGRLKAVGAGHSWSDVAAPVEGLVSLDRMRRVLAVDREEKRVTVQAGIRLHELIGALAQHALAPRILGSITQQSLAGATSTGTHGSSLVHGNLATAIVAMRLVTGEGEALAIGEGAPSSAPPLDATRVAIGALGVVTEITLAVDDAFRLEEDVAPVRFERVMAELETIARSAEYVKVWWLPPMRDVAVYRYVRTDAPGNLSAAWRAFDEKVLNAHLFDWIVRAAGRAPSIAPRTNTVVGGAYLRASRRVGAMHEVLPVAMPPVHRESEYAFALEEAADVMHELRWLLARQKLTPTFPVELRFVKGDAGWMSPAHGRDTAQLGVYTSDGPQLATLFDRFSSIARNRKARPHWGKECELDPAYVREVLPRAAAFVELRDVLDPRRVFASPYTERVLGR